jgi:hypothetical protein
MGEKVKIAGMSIGVFVLVVVVIFATSAIGIGYYKIFAPMKKNIEREVFEETKSFVHGKIQDLANYYEEYNQKDDPGEREAIRQIVITQFSQFDTDKIKNDALKQFLVRMRGY